MASRSDVPLLFPRWGRELDFTGELLHVGNVRSFGPNRPAVQCTLLLVQPHKWGISLVSWREWLSTREGSRAAWLLMACGAACACGCSLLPRTFENTQQVAVTDSGWLSACLQLPACSEGFLWLTGGPDGRAGSFRASNSITFGTRMASEQYVLGQNRNRL